MSEVTPLKSKAVRVMSVYFPDGKDGFHDADKQKKRNEKAIKIPNLFVNEHHDTPILLLPSQLSSHKYISSIIIIISRYADKAIL
jgi:hypothetical protein